MLREEGEPRPPDVIREELEELHDIQRTARREAQDDFASRLTLRQLRKEESLLYDELAEAKLQAGEIDGNLTLDGDDFEDHSAPMDILGPVFSELQDTHFALAQAKEGEPPSRGGFPDEIKRKNRLKVTAGAPGSFRVQFRLPRPEGTMQDSLPDDESTVPEETLDDLLACIHPGTDEGILAEKLAHKRVRSHFRELMKVVSREEVDLSINTRSSDGPVRLSSDQAAQRFDWLREREEDQETREVQGILRGGSTEKGRFEIEVEDDEVISGGITDTVRRQLPGLSFDERVRAEILEETEEHGEVEGERKKSYTALSIEPFDS